MTGSQCVVGDLNAGDGSDAKAQLARKLARSEPKRCSVVVQISDFVGLIQIDAQHPAGKGRGGKDATRFEGFEPQQPTSRWS